MAAFFFALRSSVESCFNCLLVLVVGASGLCEINEILARLLFTQWVFTASSLCLVRRRRRGMGFIIMLEMKVWRSSRLCFPSSLPPPWVAPFYIYGVWGGSYIEGGGGGGGRG